MICIFGFMDNVKFAHNGTAGIGDAIKAYTPSD